MDWWNLHCGLEQESNLTPALAAAVVPGAWGPLLVEDTAIQSARCSDGQ